MFSIHLVRLSETSTFLITPISVNIVILYSLGSPATLQLLFLVMGPAHLFYHQFRHWPTQFSQQNSIQVHAFTYYSLVDVALRFTSTISFQHISTWKVYKGKPTLKCSPSHSTYNLNTFFSQLLEIIKNSLWFYFLPISPIQTYFLVTCLHPIHLLSQTQ